MEIDNCVVCGKYLKKIGEQEQGMCIDCDIKTDEIAKSFKEKIYFLKDQKKDMAGWIKGLNASGYAGINKQGTIVDRREFPSAVPVQKNSLFGVEKPKKL